MLFFGFGFIDCSGIVLRLALVWVSFMGLA